MESKSILLCLAFVGLIPTIENHDATVLTSEATPNTMIAMVYVTSTTNSTTVNTEHNDSSTTHIDTDAHQTTTSEIIHESGSGDTTVPTTPAGPITTMNESFLTSGKAAPFITTDSKSQSETTRTIHMVTSNLDDAATSETVIKTTTMTTTVTSRPTTKFTATNTDPTTGSSTRSGPLTTANKTTTSTTTDASISEDTTVTRPTSPRSTITTMTESSSTSGTAASITTRDSKPQSETTRIINITELSVSLTFSIKFNRSFDMKLFNAGSSVYNRTKQWYEKKLTQAFRDTKYNFQRLSIVGFWEGSLGMTYEVYYLNTVLQSIEDFVNNLTVIVLPKLVDLTKGFDNTTITYAFSTLHTQLRQMHDDPCKIPRVCSLLERCSVEGNKDQVRCTHLCDGHTCYNQGECVVRNETELYCRCTSDSTYVYSGEQCEVQTEKLQLSSTNIIIIAAGGGGGLVFILAVALLVTCIKRKTAANKKQWNDRKPELSFHSHDGVHGGAVIEPTLPTQRLYRDQQHIAHTQQDTGLPPESPVPTNYRPPGQKLGDAPAPSGGHMMKGEDGRMYRVVKESQLYKPGGDKSGNSAFRNQAYERFPDDAPTREDHHQSQPRYIRSNNLPQRASTRTADHHYSTVDDEYTIYQPSVGYSAGDSHLNPVVAADPNELSGFPRADYGRQENRHVPARGGAGDSNLRRPNEARMFSNSKTRYSAHDTQGVQPVSGYRDGERMQPGGPVPEYRDQGPGYPTKEDLVTRRDPYPPRTDEIYSRVSRSAPGGPTYGDDMRGVNPVPPIDDYSKYISTDVKQGYSPYISGADTSRAPQGYVYDNMDGRRQVSIQRPAVSNNPLF